MNVFINGKKITIQNTNNQHVVSQALIQFLSEYQQQTTFAVALNSDFISKENYEQTHLKDGDIIDVLFPIQGG